VLGVVEAAQGTAARDAESNEEYHGRIAGRRTVMAVGIVLTIKGGTDMAVGGTVVAGAVTLEVGSGGTATIVAGPAAVAGGALVGVGAVETGVGTLLIVNASKVGPLQAPGSMGEYGDVGGHHVHGKAGFRDHPSYDPDRGFSISQDFMKRRNWDHQAMSAAQRRMFDQLAASGRPNTLREHTRIAVEALKAGGATEAEARSIVAQSLRNLRSQGVRGPTRIPWNN
jgi:hypothetical protein